MGSSSCPCFDHLTAVISKRFLDGIVKKWYSTFSIFNKNIFYLPGTLKKGVLSKKLSRRIPIFVYFAAVDYESETLNFILVAKL